MLDKRNIKDIFQLTPIQEGIYYHTIYNNYPGAYFTQTKYRVTENINIDCIKKSFHESKGT